MTQKVLSAAELQNLRDAADKESEAVAVTVRFIAHSIIMSRGSKVGYEGSVTLDGVTWKISLGRTPEPPSQEQGQ